jgi:RNA-directed DNA polymerase
VAPPKPIVSVRHLAQLLGVRTQRLYEVAQEIADNRYTHYKFWSDRDDRNPSKFRHFQVPKPELRLIQQRLRQKVLEPLGVSRIAHGGIKGRSPLSNALEHAGQPCVVNLDVKDFFPNVEHCIVYRTLRWEYGFGKEVAYLITRLTTVMGRLPQGAPTSTTLGNLVLAQQVDGPLARRAEALGIRVTRFVDDITLSGLDPRPLINVTGRLLARKRLPMHRRKTRFHPKPKLTIVPRSDRQVVTGLTVNRQVSVPRERRDAVRAAIFQLPGIADAKARATALASILGRLAHVAHHNPGAARRLRRQLEMQIL